MEKGYTPSDVFLTEIFLACTMSLDSHVGVQNPMEKKKLEKLLGVDRAQVRRAMMTKTDLMRLVDVNLTPPGAPQGQTCAQREIR